MSRRLGFILAVVLVMLAGCAASEPATELASDPAIETSDTETAEDSKENEHVSDFPKTGSGSFVASDGMTTGTVSITVREVSGRPLASLKFKDLDAPYDEFGIGGALEPRGEDPCFDTGFRSSTHDFRPVEGIDPGPLPASHEDLFLSEIILYLNYAMEGYSDEGSCINSIIARAPIDWGAPND